MSLITVAAPSRQYASLPTSFVRLRESLYYPQLPSSLTQTTKHCSSASCQPGYEKLHAAWQLHSSLISFQDSKTNSITVPSNIFSTSPPTPISPAHISTNMSINSCPSPYFPPGITTLFMTLTCEGYTGSVSFSPCSSAFLSSRDVLPA